MIHGVLIGHKREETDHGFCKEIYFIADPPSDTTHASSSNECVAHVDDMPT